MKESSEQILKKANLKVTNPRVLVLNFFLNSKLPISAEVVIKKLKGKDINEVTVYRTLSSFEEKGIVKRVDIRKSSVFYEIATNHHHHIVCKSCGFLEDFKVCIPEETIKKIQAESKGFSILKEHSLEFFGECKKCIKDV